MKIKTGLILLAALFGVGTANAQSQKSISDYMGAFYNQVGINTTVGTEKSASPFIVTNNGKIFSQFSFGYDYKDNKNDGENEKYDIQGIFGTNLNKIGGLISTDITKIVNPFFNSNATRNTRIAVTDSSLTRQVTNEAISSKGEDNQTNNFLGLGLVYNLTKGDKLKFGLSQSRNVMGHEESNLVQQVQNIYDSLSTTQTVPINITQNYVTTTGVDTRVSNKMSQNTTNLSLEYDGTIKTKKGIIWGLGFDSKLIVNKLNIEQNINQEIRQTQQGNVLVDVNGDSTLIPIYNSNVSNTSDNYGNSTNTANFGMLGKIKMDYFGNELQATFGKSTNSKKALSEYDLGAIVRNYNFKQWSGDVFDLGLTHKPGFTEAHISHTFNVDWFNFLPHTLWEHTEKNFNAEKRRINSLKEIENTIYFSPSQKELLKNSIERKTSQEMSDQSIKYGLSIGRDAGKDLLQFKGGARFGPYTFGGTIGIDGYTQTSISRDLKKGNLSLNYNYVPEKTSGEISAVYTINP